jgi:hypothetical protein
MSDVSQGPGWWQASDGRWYPPSQQPQQLPPPPAPPPYQVPQVPAQYGAYPVAYSQPGVALPPLVCFACGGMVIATASVCPHCGTMLGTPKDKTVAVLLAVFLAPWNWCYTYKRDAAKFWIGISMMVLGVILLVIFVGIFLIFGVWLWAVIDAASKPDVYYRRFPNGPR